ncbi:glycosyltransferase [Synechococcus sp. CBW1002]|nr:glycosyltransferase [Synechococcus sp. CBW1002]
MSRDRSHQQTSHLSPSRQPIDPATNVEEIPKISVIVPTRHRAHSLPQLLMLYDRQSWSNKEILVLDDSDNPDSAFRDKTEHRSDAFYWHTSRRLSIGEKRNLLASRSNGDIIAHFDEDNYYAANYLEMMWKAMSTSGCDVVKLAGWFCLHEPSGRLGYWDTADHESDHFNFCGTEPVGKRLERFTAAAYRSFQTGHGFSCMYRKSCWEQTRFPDQELEEDSHFVERVLQRKGSVSFVQDDIGICLHIIRANTASRCFPNRLISEKELRHIFQGYILTSEKTRKQDVREDSIIGHSTPVSAAGTTRQQQKTVTHKSENRVGSSSKGFAYTGRSHEPMQSAERLRHNKTMKNFPDEGSEEIKVSLFTVAHNRSTLLPLLEKCILSQTYSRLLTEWVIIDDSDLDGPIFSPTPNTGLKTKLIRPKNKQPQGRERSISYDHCDGDIIIHMDETAYYPPSRVEHAVKRLMDTDHDVAGADTLPIINMPKRELWLLGPFNHNQVTANTLAFKRAALNKIRGDQQDSATNEEEYILQNHSFPLAQLDPIKTIACVEYQSSIFPNGELTHARYSLKPKKADDSLLKEIISSARLEEYQISLATSRQFAKSQGMDQLLSPRKTLAERTIQPARGYSSSQRSTRVAVITPYHNEPTPILRRCHESVLRQSSSCSHFFIADGPGNPELDSWDCRHIILGKGHRDNGNTPRGIGSLCAMNEGYDAIAYLDVDNLYKDDHIRLALARREETQADVIFTYRHVFFPDGQVIPTLLEEDTNKAHVDTSCMVLFRPAFSALSIWSEMPSKYGPICDRVMFHHLIHNHSCAWLEDATVLFESWYLGHFYLIGRCPPINAKIVPRRSALEWEAIIRQYKQQSRGAASFAGPIIHEAPSIGIAAIMGPARSGTSVLQRSLCLHYPFVGIPEHSLISQYAELVGHDPEVRHEGSYLLERFDSIGKSDPRFEWVRKHVVDLRPIVSPQKNYNLAELYIAVVESTLSRRAKEFIARTGSGFVIDKTITSSEYAHHLLKAVPSVKCILSMRNPIDQICAMRKISQEKPGSWQEPHRTIDTLAFQYIIRILNPLIAAPPNRLIIVSHEGFVRNREESILKIARFLLDSRQFANNRNENQAAMLLECLGDAKTTIYEDELRSIDDSLAFELTVNDEPWKKNSLQKAISHSAHSYNLTDFMTADEYAYLYALFQPLHERYWKIVGPSHKGGIGVRVPDLAREHQAWVAALCSSLEERVRDNVDHIF